MTSAQRIDELARSLSERLHADRPSRPGEPSYAETTTLWNGAVTSRPALVVRPRTGAEAAAAVVTAVRSGSRYDVARTTSSPDDRGIAFHRMHVAAGTVGAVGRQGAPMQSGRAPASHAPLSRRRLFGLSAGAFLAAGCSGSGDGDDRGNGTTGKPESKESARPRAAAPDGALGANFNEDPTYVDKAALDGLGTSWVRGFTVLDRVKGGMAAERLRAVRTLLDLHGQGFGTILALKFQFRKEGRTVPAPGSREMRAELAAVDKVLEAVLDKVEILTLGNEPFLETRPQERQTKLNPFYQAVAKHVIDYRDEHFPDGCRTRLHMGALNHLDDPAMLSDATEEWIDFVNRTSQLDGLDMHPHVTSAGAAQKYLDYVLPRLDSGKKFLVTEFSLVNHYQRQMPKPLPAPFLTAHGKELGLGRDTRVWQFLRAAVERPLTEEQWRDFLRMSPWFEDHKHFMRDQVTAYRETGRLAVATYGVVQGKASVRDITGKTKPWMLNSLYVPRTVRHERGAPLPRTYTVSDDFAALQREQDRLLKS